MKKQSSIGNFFWEGVGTVMFISMETILFVWSKFDKEGSEKFRKEFLEALDD